MTGRALDKVPLVVLDACCIINLWATGRHRHILEVLPYQFGVARYVVDGEVLALRPDPGSDGRGVAPAPMAPATRMGVDVPDLLQVLEVTDGLERDFVRFAAVLDDGEAWTCAHAVTLEAWVATDDRKALRILREENPPVRTIETPTLLREWAARAEPPASELRSVLRRIEARARFRPRPESEHRSWWQGALE